eukprot:Blabericola_migrator_1__2751@NODE_1785_length_3794_cov_53_322780_g1150_i0_p1_GENE_NODE_1785_length_3794_cov_53_322780_g1150_i0NODE_1785_length_3794_cov_53_322780_g1150_i0_p1_ORF_typecomplete_len783_score97_40MTA70/PF05063_14/1e53Mito_fiss_reg/PF05308_11/1_NODE_1785_length_3794_cov_53_322780_g1150_i012323580
MERQVTSHKITRGVQLAEAVASLIDGGVDEECVQSAIAVLEVYNSERRRKRERAPATTEYGKLEEDELINITLRDGVRHVTNTFLQQRSFAITPSDNKNLEALLAIFILRSIELEIAFEESAPEPKRRRVLPKPATSWNLALSTLLNTVKRQEPVKRREPVFGLPCSNAEVARLFSLFCIDLYTYPLTRDSHVLDVIDAAIPCVDSSDHEFTLSLLPMELAKQFTRRINVQFVSLILRVWEKRGYIQLKRHSPDKFKSSKAKTQANLVEHDLFDNYTTLLKSVSIKSLTEHLCLLLQDLSSSPNLCVEKTTSIYDFSPTAPIVGMPNFSVAPSLVTPSSVNQAAPAAVQGTLPVPPPPPPHATQLTVSEGVNQNPVLKSCLETPSVMELRETSPEMIVTYESDVKSLLEVPSVGDLFTKSSLIPMRTDPRFKFHRYCKSSGKDACRLLRMTPCHKLHYKRLIQPHTETAQGDCSYLDTCRHIFSCKFVHYALDITAEEREVLLMDTFRHRVVLLNQFDVLERSADSLSLIGGATLPKAVEKDAFSSKETWFEGGVIQIMGRSPTPPQWIRCDMRSLDLGIFKGLVSVVMADPPWDIRMDLPYGTLTDHEMKDLRVDLIQDEGLLFLWVTGRAMEIARDCMMAWGYRRVDELIWVKTNHLHRIIRTGRTGHWINHSKEHCLVGIKGDPAINRLAECDVIVSEVRETSRKPDEIYRMIERICPHGLKLELFGRQHNLRSNWITLGQTHRHPHTHIHIHIQAINSMGSVCTPLDSSRISVKPRAA